MSRYMCATSSKLVSCLSRPQSTVGNAKCFVACFSDNCYADRTGGVKKPIEGVDSAKNGQLSYTYVAPSNAGWTVQTLFTSIRDVFHHQKGQGNVCFFLLCLLQKLLRTIDLRTV